MEDYRCFSNPSDDNSSSDYMLRKKQKTIYTDVLKQYPNNFIKHNGLNYTENFGLNGRCLGFAKSYELLTDIKRGNCSNSSNIPNLNSYEAWSGSLYSVNYSANNVNTVVDTSYNAGNGNQIIFPMTQPAELADISWNGLYPGVIIDPSYLIFDQECMENTWRNKLVEVSFNNTNYYIQSNKLSSNYNYRTSCCLIPAPEPVPPPQSGLTITGFYFDGTYTVGGYWINGFWNTLPYPGNSYSIALSISADGTIITGLYFDGTYTVGGYWTRATNTWTPLSYPALPVYNYQAIGISADGTIITGSYNDGTNDVGGYWTRATNTWTPLLKPLLTNDSYIATGISADGTIIIGNYNTDTISVGGYWTNGIWSTLPNPYSNDYSAMGISADGTIITGYYNDGTYGVGGYWTRATNTWTTLPYPALPALNNYYGRGISADGTIITGYYNNGTIEVGGYWTRATNTWTDLPNPGDKLYQATSGVTIII
jgi:uncharacterized membrane protein